MLFLEVTGLFFVFLAMIFARFLFSENAKRVAGHGDPVRFWLAIEINPRYFSQVQNLNCRPDNLSSFTRAGRDKSATIRRGNISWWRREDDRSGQHSAVDGIGPALEGFGEPAKCLVEHRSHQHLEGQRTELVVDEEVDLAT